MSDEYVRPIDMLETEMRDRLAEKDATIERLTRERDEAKANLGAWGYYSDEARQEARDAYQEWQGRARIAEAALAKAQQERDEARATVCTTDIDAEMKHLATQVAVAFHFVQTDNKMNYELDACIETCRELILATFIRIAHPYKAESEALSAQLAKAREALTEIAAPYDGEDGRRLIPLVEIGAELRRRQKIARAAETKARGGCPHCGYRHPPDGMCV